MSEQLQIAIIAGIFTIIGGLLATIGGFLQNWYNNKTTNEKYIKHKREECYVNIISAYWKLNDVIFIKKDDQILMKSIDENIINFKSSIPIMLVYASRNANNEWKKISETLSSRDYDQIMSALFGFVNIIRKEIGIND